MYVHRLWLTPKYFVGKYHYVSTPIVIMFLVVNYDTAAMISEESSKLPILLMLMMQSVVTIIIEKSYPL